jgi:hypothetical protein
MLRLAEEEVSRWSPEAGPRSSSLVEARDEVIPAQCEGVVMVRLENPLGVENGLMEPSPETSAPEGLYKTMAVFRDHREVPVRVLNAAHRD